MIFLFHHVICWGIIFSGVFLAGFVFRIFWGVFFSEIFGDFRCSKMGSWMDLIYLKKRWYLKQ